MLKPVLEYPLDGVPEPGQFTPVRDGIRWLRLPLPMSLNHINLYLLGDAEAWDLVDTGLDTPTNRGLWEDLLSGSLRGEALDRIIVTHMHPDHAGLAGWIAAKTGAPLHMSRTDYLTCRLLCADAPGQPPDVALNFYRQAGFDDAQLESYRARFGEFGRYVSPLPESYQRLQAGQILHSADRDWRLVEGSGHAPEHICLYCADDDLFIAGDQILPTISSNISVWPTEPQANPLADWLDSCRRLSDIITNQTLVLPSHGKPFRGGVSRLEWLLQHHADQLEQTLTTCASPATVTDLIGVLFNRRLRESDRVMATGEALAHLNFLVHSGELTVDRSDAVSRYARV